MPFLIVFGVILTIMGFVLNKFTLKEVDPNVCIVLQDQQRKDIETNKKAVMILKIIGPLLIIIGVIGVFCF